MAKNPIEVAKVIRFQLSEMRIANDHHRFEDLAYEVARRRISRNLLRATGPVSAGGDQGRDFESFRSYITSQSEISCFGLARESSETLVFACTLKVDGIPTKIKSDLKTIFGSGEKPDRVYYFLGQNLNVAKRHDLKEFCSEKYDAGLEIFDRNAISEQLADAKLFWIAEAFLDMPSEFYPMIVSDEEYQDLRERWVIARKNPVSFADYLEVKRGIRQATNTDGLEPDLGEWIERMREVGGIQNEILQRKALYEICIAQLMGRGTLDPEASSVAMYFDTLPHHSNPEDYFDAAVLMSFCAPASLYGDFSIERATIVKWQKQIVDEIDSSLSITHVEGEKFPLLMAKGNLQLTAAFWKGLKDDQEIVTALDQWAQALAIAESRPLCQIDTFAGQLGVLAPFLNHLPIFQELASKSDELIAERSGNSAAAERCMTRAVSMADANQMIMAIDQLQMAKEKWFKGEAIENSIRASLLLSHWYRELHLPLAARMYAAAALEMAGIQGAETTLKLSADAAFEIAYSYLYAGEGISFVGSLKLAIDLHNNFRADPGNVEEHSEILEVLYNVITVRSCAERFCNKAISALDQVIGDFILPEGLFAQMMEASKSEKWGSLSKNEWVAKLSDEVGQWLFNDLGKDSIIRYRALGIDWRIEFDADISEIAEELAAALQIVQVDLAVLDLENLNSKVSLHVSIGNVEQPDLKLRGENSEMVWDIVIPDGELNLEHHTMFVFLIVMTVLGCVSTLEPEAFQTLVKGRFDRGLINKAFWVRPGRDLFRLAREIASGTISDIREICPEEVLEIVPLQAQELSWHGGPSTRYSVALAKSHLHKRYEAMLPFAKIVIPGLLANPAHREILVTLRNNGYLDWQILGLLINIAMNTRIAARYDADADPSMEILRAEAMVEMDYLIGGGEVGIDWNSTLTNEAIDGQSPVFLAASCDTWGLIIHTETPNIEALKRFLDERFMHSSDDIAHENVFGWQDDLPNRRIL